MSLKSIVEETDTRAGRIFDGVIKVLILVSVASIPFEMLPFVESDPQGALPEILRWLDYAIVGIFLFEYVLRVAVADDKREFCFSVFGIIDLLAFLPFGISLGRVDLRPLRVVRTFKFARYKREDAGMMKLREYVTFPALMASIILLVFLLALVYGEDSVWMNSLKAGLDLLVVLSQLLLFYGAGVVLASIPALAAYVSRARVSPWFSLSMIAIAAVPLGIATRLRPVAGISEVSHNSMLTEWLWPFIYDPFDFGFSFYLVASVYIVLVFVATRVESNTSLNLHDLEKQYQSFKNTFVGALWNATKKPESEFRQIAARFGGQVRECKNIVVCIDGTWNHPGQQEFGHRADTNVFRLWDKLAGEQADHRFGKKGDRKKIEGKSQVALYYAGVGNPIYNTKIGVAMGGAFGLGSEEIMERAWADIVREYYPGDKIFIFGFSRGAAIARLLANLIDRRGIPRTWWAFRVFGRNRVFHRSDYIHPGVQLLACWDTVGAFGIPQNILGIQFQKLNLGKNLSVAPTVKQAYHMVALDENREAFEPTLMRKDPIDQERIIEVWFPGVHSDVGGGYATKALADITLDFILDKVSSDYRRLRHGSGHSNLGPDERWGLHLKDSVATSLQPGIDDAEGPSRGDEIRPNFLGLIHEHNRRLGYHYRARQVPEGALIHESVRERMRDTKVTYVPESLTEAVVALGKTKDDLKKRLEKLKPSPLFARDDVKSIDQSIDMRTTFTWWNESDLKPASRGAKSSDALDPVADRAAKSLAVGSQWVEFRELLKNPLPEHPTAVAYRINCGRESNGQTWVERELDKAKRKFKDRIKELDKAKALFEGGDEEWAKAYAKACVDMAQVMSIEADLVTTDTEKQEKALGESRSYCGKALDWDDECTSAHFGWTVLHTWKGEWRKAQKAAEEVIKEQPWNTDAHILLGYSLFKQGGQQGAVQQLKYREALKSLRKAIRTRKKDGYLRYSKGLLLWELGGWKSKERALREFVHARGLFEDLKYDADFHFNRARLLFDLATETRRDSLKRSRLEEALEGFDRAIELNSGDANTLGDSIVRLYHSYLYRGKTLLRLGDDVKADEAFEKAKSLESAGAVAA